MTDTIADMLTRIRNANLVGKDSVEVPYSKTRAAIADVLTKEGFIGGVNQHGDVKKTLTLELNEGISRPIVELNRISKPGRRVYAKANEIPKVLNGRGVVILSTSHGVMSGKEAKNKGVGGELMCEVW